MDFARFRHETAERYKRAMDFELHAFWRERPIRTGTVLYEAYSGRGMLCNPRALFEELQAAPDLGHLRHIWVLDEQEKIDAARREYAGRPVEFVLYESKAYYRALATSQYLVNNATFPYQFSKRAGQTYVNTWHGTPLKAMGYDVPRGGPDTRNIIRNFVMADHLLSPSPFMSEVMYEKAYRLRGIYRGSLLESGQPRIDVSFDERSRARTRTALEDAGVAVGDRRIVLYAPTWRGSFYSPADQTAQLLEVARQVQAELDPAEYVVLLKVHQAAYHHVAGTEGAAGLVVPNEIPANEVLGISDLLITDYSSIFFDFLPLDRPIVYFTPDSAQYGGSRGLYMSADELPGPTVETPAELGRTVRETLGGQDRYAARREAARDRFAPWDDGRASARVVDAVFRGKRPDLLRDISEDGRKSVLIYIGGLLRNGINSSAMNLLRNLDPDRFDVSVFYASPGNAQERELEAEIPGHVRLFPRVGGINGSKRYRSRRLATADGEHRRHEVVDHATVRPIFEDEWARCFGSSRFDAIVDFSGYAALWPSILLAAPSGKKLVWLHNDLVADAERAVEGRRVHAANLRAVFSLYKYFDALVSVSGALAELNRENLSRFADAEKFVSAENLIDPQNIRLAGRGDTEKVIDRPLTVPAGQMTRGVADVLDQLETVGGVEEVVRQAQVRKLLASSSSYDKTFVTVGRLSPEKNHDRLLRAFAQVRAKHNVRLVIVGGGPLMGTLVATASELGVSEHVVFTGMQPNPFALMAAADCFVLSSDYEGQPMVFLEAKVLGLPIVSTRFGSVAGALDEGEGLVVDLSVEALAEGMARFLAGKVPMRPFDPDAYNARALDQFLQVTGLERREGERRSDNV